MFPAAVWEQLRETYPNMVSANRCPQATREDIAALWVHEMPEETRVKDPCDIEKCLRSALASGPLDLDPAREVVRTMISWFLEAPEKAVDGNLVPIQECEAAINTFYFDGYEWSAFAIGGEKRFAFGPNWVYIDGQFM
jgi:hypothetical protein